MNRRGFLSAILAASVAPAVVKAANLMPVRMLDSGIMLLGDLVIPVSMTIGSQWSASGPLVVPQFGQITLRRAEIDGLSMDEIRALAKRRADALLTRVA